MSHRSTLRRQRPDKPATIPLAAVTTVSLFVFCWILTAQIAAQDFPLDPVARPTNATDERPKVAEASLDSSVANEVTVQTDTEVEIHALGNASYRVRQMARWRLEQSPLETLAAIESCLDEVDYNTGGQLIDLLSALATHSDVTISLRARETLRAHANRVSSVGRKADTALRAIADLQEAQAIEILTHHGAHFGSPNRLGFTLNARLMLDSRELSLWIDESFSGDDEVVAWIQFLKSIDTVFFEGSEINSNHFRAVAKLPSIKNIKLKHVNVTADDLRSLSTFESLELLELCYVDVDDSSLDLLAKLPISQSLRLFGTHISNEGAERLAGQLDGIEIYCGKGGYLGIATNPKNTLVTDVIDGSGAKLAGIERDDELTHVDGVPINNMAELRNELGKHPAGDRIVISLKRTVPRTDESKEQSIVDLKFEVTLGEDPK
ncbi:MAG: PDZ domain-containing protein [Aureliella sp.]